MSFVLKEVVFNVLYFPVWWYTKGTARLFNYIIEEITDFAKSLNIGVLFKYLLKPMYGYSDFWSRVISFIVRMAQFVIYFFITIVWSLILLILLITWLLLPIFIVYNFLLALGLPINIYQL